MKLTHLSEVRTAARPQLQPKRNPFSSFKLFAGSSLALLSAFTFGSMTFPGHVAAQPVKTAVEPPFDTAGKSPHFSFLRFRSLVGYRANPIKEMRDVPAVIRTYKDKHLTDQLIANSTVAFPPDVDLGIFGLDFNLGPGIYFGKDRFSVEVGVGAELPLIIFSDKKKHTIVVETYAPYSNLYWYDVAPAPSLGSSFYLKPYLSAEVKTRIASQCSAGLGYRISKEGFVARNGTDNLESSVYNKFDLVHMNVGMPYALLCFYLPGAGSVYTYLGFRHILTEKLSDLARQGEFVYRDFALALGMSGNVAFPRGW